MATPGAAAERIEALGATTLLSRAAQPGEIAEVIAFLASSKASYVTGAVLAAGGEPHGHLTPATRNRTVASLSTVSPCS